MSTAIEIDVSTIRVERAAGPLGAATTEEHVAAGGVERAAGEVIKCGIDVVSSGILVEHTLVRKGAGAVGVRNDNGTVKVPNAAVREGSATTDRGVVGLEISAGLFVEHAIVGEDTANC